MPVRQTSHNRGPGMPGPYRNAFDACIARSSGTVRPAVAKRPRWSGIPRRLVAELTAVYWYKT